MSSEGHKRKNDQIDESSMLDKIKLAIIETRKIKNQKTQSDVPEKPKPAPPPIIVKPPGFNDFQNRMNAKRKLECFLQAARLYAFQKNKNGS